MSLPQQTSCQRNVSPIVTQTTQSDRVCQAKLDRASAIWMRSAFGEHGCETLSGDLVGGIERERFGEVASGARKVAGFHLERSEVGIHRGIVRIGLQ